MGGAAGHMRHPFDLMSVKSGNDLIGVFESLKTLINTPGEGIPNVKFDGSNVSFKVLETGELGVDRGSYADIPGITMDSVSSRFKDPKHGMRTAVPTLLRIMTLANIGPELKALGLYDNPHYFLNAEYAESGTINATAYSGNYIFIHGVNAFYENTFRGITRPGITKPLGYNPKKKKDVPVKDKSVEVPYDKKALAVLIEKANEVGQQFDPPFNVVGPVPVTKKAQIDYSSALSESITIPLSPEYLEQYPEVTALQGSSLKKWLSTIKNKPAQYYAPLYDVEIPTLAGKKINPYHKTTYVSVMDNGVNADSIVPPEHVRTLIDGMIILHATRKLGHQFLLGLTSDFGDMILLNKEEGDTDHEGVVIRNNSFGKYPFKITGEFIVTGMYGAFSTKMAAASTTITESYLKTLIKESIQRIIF
jgi:hypothetical protein